MGRFTVVEFCVGGGGQALGREAAGFDCVAAVEIDADCCTTLRLNRPQWNVLHEDMRQVDGSRWRDADLFAAGVPYPLFPSPASNSVQKTSGTCSQMQSGLSER